MPDFYKHIAPLLFKVDPETAHGLTIKVLKTGLMPCMKVPADPLLEQVLWGLKFPNPVGLSAGFDKNAEVVGAAFRMGFGFVEPGTVTPKPQAGNPRPRIFRDPESFSVINRMGFPNGGMLSFKSNFEKFLGRKPRPSGVVGINIGMNKTQSEPIKDYRILIRNLGPLADYLTVNISSPNTPGLRDLQKREFLLELIGILKEECSKACGESPPPILVKLAPDLSAEQQEELAKTALDAKIDGLILTNTTLDRPEHLPESFRAEKGGLSGAPLLHKSTEVIRNFYRLTEGKIPLIGVGGISNGHDAYRKIRAGASLVQLYTALVFHGPALVGDIIQDLGAMLRKDGFSNITEAVGADHKSAVK